MTKTTPVELEPLKPEDDEPQTWRELAEAAILDLRRYAEDELPHRRLVSAEAYEQRFEALGSTQPDGELVERVARALCEFEVRRYANKPTGFVSQVNAAVDERWKSREGAARAAIAAGVGSTLMREALEEARAALWSVSYSDHPLKRGETYGRRKVRIDRLFAKIDAALAQGGSTRLDSGGSDEG